jgi:HAD superfamily hydrolase (TIGR01549 family)
MMHKNLQDYDAVVTDMDGTLYYQTPLRICMAFELVCYYLTHINRIRELFTLRNYRKSHEKGCFVEPEKIIDFWMQEKPLKYIYFFRDKKLLALLHKMRVAGAKIIVYSDYPVAKKIQVLEQLHADYCFCGSDAVIRCLKPDSSGIKKIVRMVGLPVKNMLFIGDRYEKDGKCAEGADMDYIILAKYPFFRWKGVSMTESKNGVP